MKAAYKALALVALLAGLGIALTVLVTGRATRALREHSQPRAPESA